MSDAPLPEEPKCLTNVKVNRVYKHYKSDNLYRVLRLATMADDNEETVVIYQRIEGGRIWVRTLKDFGSLVQQQSDSDPEMSHKADRFAHVGAWCDND